jgi:hypothetical protein
MQVTNAKHQIVQGIQVWQAGRPVLLFPEAQEALPTQALFHFPVVGRDPSFLEPLMASTGVFMHPGLQN